MANTYTLISSYAATGTVAYIEFSSIPSTYTDLVLSFSGRQTVNGASSFVTFNSDTGANYSYRTLIGNGTAASSSSASGQTSLTVLAIDRNDQTASTFGNSVLYIPNYASSTTKSVSNDGVNENNATANAIGLVAGLWSGTAAISTIRITPDTGSFVQYSTAYLYGIKNS